MKTDWAIVAAFAVIVLAFATLYVIDVRRVEREHVAGVLLKDVATGQCVYLTRSRGYGVDLVAVPCPPEPRR